MVYVCTIYFLISFAVAQCFYDHEMSGPISGHNTLFLRKYRRSFGFCCLMPRVAALTQIVPTQACSFLKLLRQVISCRIWCSDKAQFSTCIRALKFKAVPPLRVSSLDIKTVIFLCFFKMMTTTCPLTRDRRTPSQLMKLSILGKEKWESSILVRYKLKFILSLCFAL